MGPKKREKESSMNDVAAVNSNKTAVIGSKIDSVQADHELFLQAFEKPTQIYRYLRTRHLLAPVFLHRSLSYMKGRITGRDHKKRSAFKVDSILESKTTACNNAELGTFKYMTLTFLGFYDSKEVGQQDVRVETLLLKIGHKKRKDVSSPIMQISFGITEVCVNPKEDEASPPKAPTVSISTEDLTLQKGANNHQGNSYVLLLRVQPPESQSDEPAPFPNPRGFWL